MKTGEIDQALSSKMGTICTGNFLLLHAILTSLYKHISAHIKERIAFIFFAPQIGVPTITVSRPA